MTPNDIQAFTDEQYWLEKMDEREPKFPNSWPVYAEPKEQPEPLNDDCDL